jgi:hypothetical protein
MTNGIVSINGNKYKCLEHGCMAVRTITAEEGKFHPFKPTMAGTVNRQYLKKLVTLVSKGNDEITFVDGKVKTQMYDNDYIIADIGIKGIGAVTFSTEYLKDAVRVMGKSENMNILLSTDYPGIFGDCMIAPRIYNDDYITVKRYDQKGNIVGSCIVQWKEYPDGEYLFNEKINDGEIPEVNIRQEFNPPTMTDKGVLVNDHVTIDIDDSITITITPHGTKRGISEEMTIIDLTSYRGKTHNYIL